MRKRVRHNTLILSQTQYKVCDLLTQGFQVKEIAKMMFISPLTVDTHIKRIKKNNGLGNIPDIVREFIIGLDDPRLKIVSKAKQFIAAFLLIIQFSIVLNNLHYDLIKYKLRVAKKIKVGNKKKENPYYEYLLVA